MTSLSIRQPWAELILCGDKDVENRGWFKRDFTGPILIHVAKKMDWPGYRFFRYDLVRHGDLDDIRGHIAGVCNVVKITKEVSSQWHEDGLWGWYLSNVVRFENPIPYKGRLGLFNVPDEKVAEELKLVGFSPQGADE